MPRKLGEELPPQPAASPLAIVTLCLNNPAELEKTLHSVAEQTASPNRVVVIDGSNEAHRERMEEISREFDAEYHWDRPRGVYAAMNVAISQLSSDNYVLFLNSGDWFSGPRTVDIVNNEITNHPQSPWLVGDTAAISNNDAYRVNTRHRNPHPTVGALRIKDFWFPHPSTITKVSAIRELGGFDTSFVIASDYHLSLKLFNEFGAPKLIPSTLSCHHLDGLSAQKPLSSTLERCKARVRTFGIAQALVEPFILSLRLLKTVILRGQKSPPKQEENPINTDQPRNGIEHYSHKNSTKTWPKCCLDYLASPTTGGSGKDIL